MRTYTLAIALAALFVLPSMAYSQGLHVGPDGVQLDTGIHRDHEHGGWEHCQRLRYHCENKEALHEEGQGNCERYRDECGGDD